MVLCSEVNQGDRFDEAKVKLLTGGDTLTARFMNENHFTFEPTHKLWLMGNDQPSVNSGGVAFWERLKLIAFDNYVPTERRIQNLQDIFASEHGPAVLAWVVRGAVDYFSGGLAEPDSVKVATSGYAYSQDSVKRWFDDCCERTTSPNVKVNTNAARKSYERWCSLEGETAANITKFGNALKRLGIVKTRSHGARFYEQMILKDEESEVVTADEEPSPWITGME
jgi:P4 family phage/plasmid primase-like protien